MCDMRGPVAGIQGKMGLTEIIGSSKQPLRTSIAVCQRPYLITNTILLITGFALNYCSNNDLIITQVLPSNFTVV